MEDQEQQLFVAIDEDDVDTAKSIVASGIDLNTVRDDLGGVPPLFAAVLKGNLELIQLLLDNGADPNFLVEDEEVAAIYAEKPLHLARQARLLFNWDQFQAVVQLLEKFGATYVDGTQDSPDDVERCKAEALRWQAKQADI